MEFLDGTWKKEVTSWEALLGEEQHPKYGRCCVRDPQKKRGTFSDCF